MQIQEADATAKKLRVAAASLGCKVNSYDTQAMLGLFADRGYEIVPFEELADIYIVNTCAVTNTGGKKSRQMARRAAAANPGAVVVACGCQTQAKPEEFAEMPGVDLVLGTWRSGIVDAVEEILAKRQEKPVVRVGDVLHDHAYEPIALGSASALGSAGAFGRIRANLKVQDGCGRFCAYCIIPYARGPSRSRDMEDAVNEAKSLAAQGLKEIVLAGIHLASYGQDLYNSDLTGLILRLQEVAGIERIRLGSLEPGSISVPFLEALKMAPKVCGHFHLSLQSGCDKTLKRMNRRYSKAQFMEAVQMSRESIPGLAVSTDMIAGFPGETSDDFSESLEFARSVGFAKIHAFPFSPMAGTPAAKFPGQVTNAEKARRTALLTQLSDESGRAFRESFIGKTLKVLFERETDPGAYDGLSENYLRVRVSCGHALINQVREAKILSAGPECMAGEVAQP